MRASKIIAPFYFYCKNHVMLFWHAPEPSKDSNIQPPCPIINSVFSSVNLQQERKNNNKQLLDSVEQNIVICQWRADLLFVEAKG